MAEQSDRSQLPPGWECRYDIRSGRPYVYIAFNGISFLPLVKKNWYKHSKIKISYQYDNPVFSNAKMHAYRHFIIF